MTKFPLLGATLFVALCGPARLAAAPAPFYPKDAYVGPVNETSLVGTWEVVCGPYRSVVTFHRDGRYFGRRDGREYSGTWKMERTAIRIEESVSGEEAPSRFWVGILVASGRQKFVGTLVNRGKFVSMGLSVAKDTVFSRVRSYSRDDRR
jgi:hypothetical protein